MVLSAITRDLPDGSMMSPHIRNSAQALIVEDERLLCIRKQDAVGSFAVLPGGGQLPGETLLDALRRECREEMAVEIAIHELRFVREYVGRNHEFAAEDADVHHLNFIFRCSIPPGSHVRTGPLPDEGQLAIEWVPLGGLVAARLYPLALSRQLALGGWDGLPVYLGDIN
jgi:ADP-ribose pyrophosphatase YjhB (NUDIX family)